MAKSKNTQQSLDRLGIGDGEDVSRAGTILTKQSTVSSVALVHKGDTLLAVNQPLEIEDEFRSLYEGAKNEKLIIQPPYNPQTLAAMCFRNNILMQCVHAMEVNVDGTGFTIELKEGEEEDETQTPGTSDLVQPELNVQDPNAVSKADAASPKKNAKNKVDPEKKKAEDFFNEPYPGMSFITMRRKLRVDLEQLGYGYLEVIRNVANEIIFLRHIRGITVRMIRLDQPVEVDVSMERGGETFNAKMLMRERKFVQRVSQKLLWYKEFGVKRNLDKTTGEWETDGNTIPIERRASELLMFQVDLDIQTPYGLPRWINNTPSALGSRKAEEFNLEFFDAGGMPPAIIFIQGGSLTTTTKDQLLAHLAGGEGQRKRLRAAVVEIQSSSGTLDATNKVDVKTERFGDAKMNDSMFQNYDEKCEEHIRVAFRLPPLFLGKAADYNFATAVTAYQVAEAQVFQPERIEFDEIINATVMKELGIKKYKFKSKPITLQDAEKQMKALDAGKDKINDQEHIDKLNQISGLDMQHDPKVVQERKQIQMGTHPSQVEKARQAHENSKDMVRAQASARRFPQFPSRPNAETGKAYGSAKVVKFDNNLNEIGQLVDDWIATNGLDGTDPLQTGISAELVQKALNELSESDAIVFNALLSARLGMAEEDPVGMGELLVTASEHTH